MTTDVAAAGFDPARIRLNGYEVKALTALATAPEEHYWPFRRIEEVSGLPKMHVRRIVRLLARKGLARFAAGLTNDDGEMAGAGYQITEEGRSLCASA